jgi:dihydroorotase
MPAQVHLTDTPLFDLVIFGGRVIDPANGIDGPLDIGISGGVITAVASDLPRNRAKQIYNAGGKLVAPGLIDTHVHVFDGVAPYGMDADEYCLSRGSTTVLDCGDAGCNSLEGLKMYVARRTQCRVLALCHAAATGLVSPDPMGMDPNMGEMTDLSVVNVPKAVHAIKSDLNSADPFCVGASLALSAPPLTSSHKTEKSAWRAGVKVRLSRAVSNGGANEREGFKRALQIAEESGTALMVHHAGSSLTVTEVLSQLRRGDMYTHCFHAGSGEGTDTALADTDTLSEVTKEARARGVLFDLGHGQGSFSWNCAEAAVRPTSTCSLATHFLIQI